MSKNIYDYFNDIIEYPEINKEILPYNILYEYISSTFLNGFVNYAKWFKCWLIDRYYSNEAKTENIIKFNTDNHPHTELGNLCDDIVLLGTMEDCYIFMYYDCDVSDCQIGRFKTEDQRFIIVDSVINYFKEEMEGKENIEWKENTESGIRGYTEIDCKLLTGWISF